MKNFIEEVRRKQIIAAAITVMTREEYVSATLSRIAKEAAISKKHGECHD